MGCALPRSAVIGVNLTMAVLMGQGDEIEGWLTQGTHQLPSGRCQAIHSGDGVSSPLSDSMFLLAYHPDSTFAATSILLCFYLWALAVSSSTRHVL